MKFKFSLRYRVALAFLVLGWVISMAMGSILYWLTIRMEEQLIEETLSTELEDYMIRYNLDTNTLPPSSTHLQGYVITDTEQTSAPAILQHLSIGLSHISMEGKGYYVETRLNEGLRFVVLYADDMIKQRENQYLVFLAIGIVFMTLISSVLGLWLAERVISPVTHLAKLVSEMKPDFGPLPLKQDIPYDEVDELAHAIDGYHQRLRKFNERERAFTSDVSHELRTPLTVIDGAAEVMLTEQDLSDPQRLRIERIKRATTQISRLTTALLSLAREEFVNESDYECSVDKALTKIVKEHQYLLNHKPVKVDLDVSSSIVIKADPELLYVVLANIIRNAFAYTSQGIVHIYIEDDRVVIEDTGTGMGKDQLLNMFNRFYSDTPSGGGHGIGLSLVKRICERYGWKISIRSHKDSGTSVELFFNHSF